MVDPQGTLVASVRAVEWLGHECLIFAGVGEQAIIVRVAGMADLAPGGELRLRVEPGGVHLFDAETTERLT